MERWNTHFDTEITVEVLGVALSLAQDPSSHHLGTTVWDASLVFAHWAAQRQGDFARVRGKRVLELGAGAGGVAGMALALLGAHVTLTDVNEVLPLLRANVANNISPAALRVKGGELAVKAGIATVEALDWLDEPASWSSLSPPYDYIIATDCVYSEPILPHFLKTVLHFAGPRTTVCITNEFRSQAVQDLFTHSFSEYFQLKQVPLKHQNPDFRHPLIRIHILKLKKSARVRQKMCELPSGGMEQSASLAPPGGGAAQQGRTGGGSGD